MMDLVEEAEEGVPWAERVGEGGGVAKRQRGGSFSSRAGAAGGAFGGAAGGGAVSGGADGGGTRPGGSGSGGRIGCCSQSKAARRLETRCVLSFA